jgi:hypothetical protein
MKKLALLASATLLVSTFSFAQTLHSLDKDQVTKALQGNTIKTIPLVTLNNKLIENSMTGYFDQDGKIHGQLSNKPAGEPQADEGNWQVQADGTLCATWQHWNNKQPICVTVYKLTNGLLLVNKESEKFESLILQDSIKSGKHIG